MTGPVAIGDVWAVHTAGIPAKLIDIGDVIEGKPTPANHVVVAHHQDARGRWWGVEGRPGGVAWCEMAGYTTGPAARLAASNYQQPRTAVQRAAVAKAAEGLLHVGYDWVGGIIPDGFDDVGLKDLAGLIDKWWGWGSEPDDGGTTTLAPAPGHVVCSSLAAWVYDHLGLPAPAGDAELVQPADWWDWNTEEGWLTR